MSDWVDLHTFYADWVDGMISAEADPEAHAVLSANRDDIVAYITATMQHKIEQQQREQR